MTARADGPGVDVTVTDVPGSQRYEARVDGRLAGVADYLPAGESLVFTHTEVGEGFEGRGVAGALIRGALDDVRRRRLSVVPVCPFVRRFIAQHPDEYSDLVRPDGTPGHE